MLRHLGKSEIYSQICVCAVGAYLIYNEQRRKEVGMDFSDGLQSPALPLGLAFGMALDEQALTNYAGMTEYEKEKLIAQSKGVKSKEEMQQLIQRISDDSKLT